MVTHPFTALALRMLWAQSCAVLKNPKIHGLRMEFGKGLQGVAVNVRPLFVDLVWHP